MIERLRVLHAGGARWTLAAVVVGALGCGAGRSDPSTASGFEPTVPEAAGRFVFEAAAHSFESDRYGRYEATVRVPSGAWRGPYPVVIISTGIGSVGEDASWWAEHLATHGYLTMTFTPPNPDQWDLDQWVVGYGEAISSLERGEGPLAMGDPSRPALLGTSFGGTAVIEVAGTDARVRAAVALAPGINDLATSFFDGALSAAPSIRVPIQLHMGSNDCILNPREDTVLGFTVGEGRAVLTYYDLIPGPRQYVEIQGGNHTGYRNLPPPGASDVYVDLNLDCPREITAEEQHRLASRYATMWLDRALYGTDAWDDALFGAGIERDLADGLLSAHLEDAIDR